MTMMLNVKDRYVEQLEKFVNTLPKDAIVIKNSLDVEIASRVENYKNDNLNTVSFENGLSSIREKLQSQI